MPQPNFVASRFLSSCLLLLPALASLTLATAQEEPFATQGHASLERGVPVADFRVPIHTAEPDAGFAYGVWTAGSHYKASFHDGFTYVPILGTSYPHNLPLAWRTLSVRVGDHELVTQQGQLAWTEWRAEYDLGKAVEAYDVLAEGIEQTFVVRHRPAVIGDLVVRGAIATSLHATAAGPAHQAVVFHDAADIPIVSYGAATAVDANGRRRPMTTRFADGEIELRLDAEWLAEAAFPVVVDPLLGPATKIFGSTRTEVDTAQEPVSIGDSVWVAYGVAASASDLDLYVQRWSFGGSLGSTPFVDVTSSWSTAGARCGYANSIDYAVIVFDRSFPSGSRSLRFHRHLNSDAATSTAFQLITTTDNAWRADVGTVSNSVSPHAFVVWQQEPNGGGAFAESSGSDIWGCHLDLLTGAVTTPFPIANASLVDHERPRTSAVAGGGADGWKVVYQHYSTLVVNDDWDVALREVTSAGAISAAIAIDDGSPDHKMAPQIDGRASTYAVAFTSSTLAQQPGKPSGANGHQIRTVRLHWDVIANTATQPHGTVVLQNNADPRLELGGLAFDTWTWSHWGLLFRSTATELLYFRTIGMKALQLQAETVFNPAGSDTSVSGGVGFSSNYREFTIAYANNGSTGGNYVTFDRFDYPAVTPWATTGPGCSQATISWDGEQLIGSQYNHLRVNGAPPNAIHVMIIALAPASSVFFGNPLFFDGCWLLVPNLGPDHITMLVDVGSSVSWYIPLPEFLTNDTFYFQDFHTDSNQLLQFWSTPRLEVPIVK